MSPSEFNAASAEYMDLFNACKPSLSQDEQSAITHYLSNSELEMAVELMCLDLIARDVRVDRADKVRLRAIVLAVGLDSCSIFDSDFWFKFQRYLEMS